MAKNQWIGGAKPVPQETRITVANIEEGDVIGLVMGGQLVSVVAESADPYNVLTTLALTIIGVTTGPWDEVDAAIVSHEDSEGNQVLDYLRILGPDDGTPFTVTSTTTNASGFTISIIEQRRGAAPQNEVQRIFTTVTPTAGNFKLYFGGQTTADIAFNAGAGTVQAALEALANIAPGDVTVTQNGTMDYNVAFSGVYATKNVPRLQIALGTSPLTGGTSVAVTRIQEGNSLGTPERWALMIPAELLPTLDSFNFQLNQDINGNGPYAGDSIAVGPAGPTADAIRVGLKSIQHADGTAVYDVVDVTGDQGGPFDIKIWKYGPHGGDDNLLAIGGHMLEGVLVDGPFGGGTAFLKVSDRNTTPVPDQQLVALIGRPATGQFRLTFEGQQTADVPFNASAATVQAALEGLSNLLPTDVTVTGDSLGPWTVQFDMTLNVGPLERLLMTGTNGTTPLSPGGQTEVIQLARLGVNEIQVVTIPKRASGGTFTLGFGAESQPGIPANATAAQVQAALESLATPVPGDFIVTGNDGGPWVVEFTGTYANSDVALMTGDASTLTSPNTQAVTITLHQASTGPYHLSNVYNWSLGALPVDGDTIVFKDFASHVRFDLDALTQVTPAAVESWASMTGEFGLADINTNGGGYREFRSKKIELGRAADGITMEIFIGYGEGSGSALMRFHFNDCPYNLHCRLTGQTNGGDKPPLVITGGHANATANIARGRVGFAPDAADTAALGTLRMSSVDDPQTDAFVVAGPDTSVGIITKHAGTLELNSGPSTSFEQTAGTTTFQGTAAITSPIIRGGDFIYNSSGTLNGTALVAGDGQLDFGQDIRPKTVANPIDVYGDAADVLDPYKVASTSGESPAALVVNYHETTRNEALGRNYQLKRLAI